MTYTDLYLDNTDSALETDQHSPTTSSSGSSPWRTSCLGTSGDVPTSTCVSWMRSFRKHRRGEGEGEGRAQYDFNETVWGATTRCYLDPINNLSDEKFALVVEETQKTQ
ncbi:hypothetical protein J3R82DRAFT_2885 [Butyriboletus roseoflavus]|nr:hypothetical protein J3R82DRAFT_2885 [Butyriboletus roseoflavus]